MRRAEVMATHVACLGMAWLSLSSLAVLPPRSDAKLPLLQPDSRLQPRAASGLNAFIGPARSTPGPWNLRAGSNPLSHHLACPASGATHPAFRLPSRTRHCTRPWHHGTSSLAMVEEASLLSRAVPRKGGAGDVTQRVDFTTLTALVAELQVELPMKVGGVWQSGESEVTFSFLEEGPDEEDVPKDRWLVLSWSRDTARLCKLSAPPWQQNRPSALSSLLASYTSSLFLVSATVLPFSPSVELLFSSIPAAPAPPPPLNAVPSPRESAAGSGDVEGGGAAAEEGEDGAFSVLSETLEGDEGMSIEEEEEEEEVRCTVVLSIPDKGQSRLLLVDDKDTVVTAAPAADRRGNVFHRIGRRYPPLPPPAGKAGPKDEGKDGGQEEGGAPDRVAPSLEETVEQWQERVVQAAAASPAASLKAALLTAYKGLSWRLVEEMLWAAAIPASEPVGTMVEEDYASLWQVWRGWLWAVSDSNFIGLLRQGHSLSGYSVIPWPEPETFDDEETAPTEDPSAEYGEEAGGGGEGDTEDGGADRRTGSLRMGAGSVCVDEQRSKLSEEGGRSVSECVAAYYELAELQALQKRLLTALQTGIRRQRSKISDFQSKLAEAAEAPRWKALGNALAANQHLVKFGMSKVEVPDWEALSERSTSVPTVEIELDPKLNGQDNAARLFKKYKKLVRQDLLDDATKALMELVEAEGAVQNVPYREGAARARGVLAELEQRLVRRNILSAPPSEDAAQAKAAALREERVEKKGEKKLKLRGRGPAPNFLRFESPSGLQVVAGRSSRQNDRVTWGLARDKDLWFHARGIGGSHVILMLPPGSAPSGEDIKFAAEVAAFYSKAKGETRVDVSYTERKYLRPPPQRIKRPGMVFITREQVVTVRPRDWKKINDGG